MKKCLFLIPLVLGLFACSNEDIVDNPNTGATGEVEYSYLAVKIVPTQVTGTRAGEDNGNLVYGSETENNVNNIRFYFFSADGKAVAVKSNGQTYYDVYATNDENNEVNQSPGKDDHNVEKEVKTIVVIESDKGDLKPYYLVTVVNGEESNLPESTAGTTTITALQEKIANYSSTTNFVMSSSVYKASDNSVHFADYVFDNIQTSKELAEQKPATIYVERILAKISASVSINDAVTIGTDKLYKVGEIVRAGESTKDKDIYVKFLGWNVTATRNKAYLGKKIDTSWDHPTISGWGETWNDISHERSYWAVNYPTKNLATDYTFGTFGKNSDHFDNASTDANKYDFETDESRNLKNYTYLLENAPKVINGVLQDTVSKIIVAAQLVDKNGKALNLVEYGGAVWEKDEFLNYFASSIGLYKFNKNSGTKEQPGSDRYIRLTKDDLTFEQKDWSTDETNADDAYKASGKRYYVTLALKDQKSKYAYYDSNNKEFDEGENGEGYAYDKAISNPVTEALKIGNIKAWTTGYTYYWLDIRHLGGIYNGEIGEGMYGVVRNHWYQYTFTSVKGLGIPVFDPDQPIYPENPEDPNEFFLAAEIKVLAWRMVNNNNAELGWEKTE